MTSGWKPPRCGAPFSTDSSAAPLQWMTLWLRQLSDSQTAAIALSGTVRKTMSDASTIFCASPRERLATPVIV